MLFIRPIPKKIYVFVPILASMSAGSGFSLLWSISNPAFANNTNDVVSVFWAWGCLALTITTTLSMVMASKESQALLNFKASLMDSNRPQYQAEDQEFTEFDTEDDPILVEKKYGRGFHKFRKGWNSYFEQANSFIQKKDERIVRSQAPARRVNVEPPHNRVSPNIPSYVTVKQMRQMSLSVFRGGNTKLKFDIWAGRNSAGERNIFTRRGQFEPLLEFLKDQGLAEAVGASGTLQWTNRGLKWLGMILDQYKPLPHSQTK